ncbi:unnamed protein product [Litomosoides sigmodontis]|uniref:Uncharacterized protein n=1 Tax=Litomosoides sigmodontis TaxID=42156 RepID=A0A3P6TWP1_LITSI|nr:unnamed protein product [Litomosoides sigmodontis]
MFDKNLANDDYSLATISKIHPKYWFIEIDLFQLYCRNGQSHIPETRVPSLCPSSSTSCGYFEFEKMLLPEIGDEQLGIYECVDPSILMPDNDDNDEIKQLLFSKYCDDQARCREIMLSSFSPKFIQSLIEQANVRYFNGEDNEKLKRLLTKRVKFCCAINDHLLQQIIHSDDYVLPTLAPSSPVICHNVHCRGAPIGCLTYSEFNQTQQSVEEEEEDVAFVQPMRMSYDDYTMIPSQPINNMYRYAIEYHCVYRHFNDEMYRYCLLINEQQRNENNHCFYGDSYRICCCFLHRGERTCDPLASNDESAVKASAEISEALINGTMISPRASNTTKLRTRCRIVDEVPSEFENSMNRNRRKKFVCETNVINASYKFYFCNTFLLMLCYFADNYLFLI